MNLKTAMVIMVCATIVAACGLIFTLFYVNPFDRSLPGFIMFYATLFLLLFGLAASAGVAVRYRRRPDEQRSGAMLLSVRQAAIIAVLLTILLILQGVRLLNLWNGVALVAFAAVVEYFFLSLRSRLV